MTVYNKDDPATIQALFSSIAKSYDRTNSLLSFRMHQLWNRRLIREVLQSQNPHEFLDLCCGTGEIGLTYLKGCKTPTQAFLLDFCEEMLLVAQHKAKLLDLEPHSISYLQADAQQIPLANASVQCATIAYGIRNVRNPALCMQEVLRVLKPGGTFGILELTKPSNTFMQIGHKLYLSTVVPTLGKWAAANQEAYQYLCNSIQQFVRPPELQQMLLKTGFKETAIIPLTGGLATIIIAKKYF